MKMTWKTTAIAAAAFASAMVVTLGFADKAEARRLYVSPYGHGPFRADLSGLSWDAVRAYYVGGPWCGAGGPTGYGAAAGALWAGTWGCYSGWADYKGRNGIGCDPGTLVKGGDGIDYVCQ